MSAKADPTFEYIVKLAREYCATDLDFYLLSFLQFIAKRRGCDLTPEEVRDMLKQMEVDA